MCEQCRIVVGQSRSQRRPSRSRPSQSRRSRQRLVVNVAVGVVGVVNVVVVNIAGGGGGGVLTLCMSVTGDDESGV